METILFLAHTEADGTLGKPAFEALTAAKALVAALPAATFLVGLIGEQVQTAAEAIAGCGVTRFLGVSGSDFAASRYATDAAACVALAQAAGATLVVAAGTSRFSRSLPGAAQRLGGRAETHVSEVSANEERVTVTRWYYRQRLEAILERTTRPWFLLIDPGSQAAWSGAPGSVAVENVPVTLPDAARRTTVVGFRAPTADLQTIRPEASLLFVAGAGWTKKQADGQTHAPEAAQLIREFLELTRASLGSSKSLVDQRGEGEAVLPFVTHLNQVGQTGATPRHPKGLATCCHGEEPHTVGWRFIHERRAISLDPNCGWARGKADVLYVADAFQVMARVNARLGAHPGVIDDSTQREQSRRDTGN